MARPAIVADDVSLRIGGAAILSQIALTIPDGARWALLGANGSGKTTLLRLFAGHGFPSSGTLEVLGCRFGRCDLRELRKRVGWVHADVRYQIPVHMTALEVVISSARGGLVLYHRPDSSSVEHARRCLDDVGMEPLGEQRFATLSTGERQRTLIARALYASPELLLLDEPCIGLDPGARERFLADLEQVLAANPHLTALYVTHEVAEIRSYYDGVVVLDAGRVLAAGPIATALTESNLRQAFGAHCSLRHEGGRFALSFAADGR